MKVTDAADKLRYAKKSTTCMMNRCQNAYSEASTVRKMPSRSPKEKGPRGGELVDMIESIQRRASSKKDTKYIDRTFTAPTRQIHVVPNYSC